MITVTNLAGQTEALNGIQGFEMVKDTDGNFSTQFSSFPILDKWSNPGHALIEEESVIDVEGFLFRVKQLKETRTRKEVTAISTFYDLKGVRQDTIYGGTRTFNEFATFTLQGTGWTFSTTDVTESRFIENFGEENVIKLIEALCATFECEYEIMPGNHVIFAKQIGGDYESQYRYGHNVKALYKNVDTTNLRTEITGYGADGLIVTYLSPNHVKYGIHKADPVRDDQYSESDSMLELLKRTLVDYPEATFEMETVELTNKELGERVWLIYEPMGLEFQTRILSKVMGMRNGNLYTKSVVLGNTIPRSLENILVSQKVDIDNTNKEFRSRIEQTNELIKLEVEQVNTSIATLNIRADDISLSVSTLGDSVNGRVDGLASSVGALSVRADNIMLSVTQVNNNVSAVGEAVARAEASISVQAGLISSKVSQTDFNGNTIVSMINQTPASISIEASKINLTGYVTINSLNTPGHVTINEGNIVGSSFTVGRGSGNPQLSMYAIQGSHRILSADGAGFRVESTGTMSLKSGSGKPITMLGFTRVAGDLSIEPYNSAESGATPLLATNLGQSKVVVNGLLEVSSISVAGKAGIPAVFS